MKKLNIYIGLNEGYANNEINQINEKDLIKRVIDLFSNYTYNNITGFNTSIIEWNIKDYKEMTVLFSTIFNEKEININIMLNAIIPILKEEFKQESILTEIIDGSFKFY